MAPARVPASHLGWGHGQGSAVCEPCGRGSDTPAWGSRGRTEARGLQGRAAGAQALGAGSPPVRPDLRAAVSQLTPGNSVCSV